MDGDSFRTSLDRLCNQYYYGGVLIGIGVTLLVQWMNRWMNG
jgi:Na+/phosphate symporter